MAKIILTKDGKILQEITLLKERITIGRRPHNDLVIEDIAISGEHAMIELSLADALLEDLNSTNGTQVNGQPVKKHFLLDHDVIELAEYRLRYVADTSAYDENAHAANASTAHGRSLDLLLDGAYPKMWRGPTAVSAKPHQGGAIRLLTGAKAGNQIDLTKPLTTVGQPGVQVAAIALWPQGYCLTHVDGDVFPLINGHSIGTNTCAVAHGDVIDLVGVRVKFLLG